MQERKSFDEKFVRMDTKRLCELTSAADSLQLKPLVDLTSRALARVIEGKTPEEIREIFHLPDDLTEVFCRCQQCTSLMSFSFWGECHRSSPLCLICSYPIDTGRKVGTYQKHHG